MLTSSGGLIRTMEFLAERVQGCQQQARATANAAGPPR